MMDEYVHHFVLIVLHPVKCKSNMVVRETLPTFQTDETDENEPWHPSRQQPYEAVIYLIVYLKCLIGEDSVNQECEQQLKKLINTKRFKQMDRSKTEDVPLYKKAYTALIDPDEENILCKFLNQIQRSEI